MADEEPTSVTYQPYGEISFVGGFEMVCGSLVVLGLLTRLAVILLLAIMAVALTTTKWPMLAAQGSWYMAVGTYGTT